MTNTKSIYELLPRADFERLTASIQALAGATRLEELSYQDRCAGRITAAQRVKDRAAERAAYRAHRVVMFGAESVARADAMGDI